MNFSDALTSIKQGEKLTRAGWNGKGMFIFYVKQSNVLATDTGPWAADDKDPPLRTEPYVCMSTADGKYVPWLCSQADMLADDWEVAR